MSLIDVDKLLAPVSPDQPCGENLEYDADYAAMEQAAAGKPEQQFGATVIPGEEPNWKEVCEKATGLLERTKDLRIGTYLARGAARLEGMTGLADGLAVIHGLVEKYWEGVYPQLDPEDNNDPTERMNTLGSLSDPAAMLRAIREAPLVRSKSLGTFAYRDVLVANGDLPPPAGTEKIESSTIEGAFADGDGDGLQAVGAALRRSLETTRKLELELAMLVGAGQAPPLDSLTELLETISKLVHGKLAARGLLEEESPAGSEADGGASAEQADGDGQAGAAAVNGRKASAGTALTGDITNRGDVIRALDKINEYYKRYEPSSPVPLLINRAKRLASKSFLEILRDLTPDALNQALAIGGITDGAEVSEVEAPQ
jgi:type VI secretion system protein ImpA